MADEFPIDTYVWAQEQVSGAWLPAEILDIATLSNARLKEFKKTQERGSSYPVQLLAKKEITWATE